MIREALRRLVGHREPPTPSEAGRALSKRANAPDVKARAQARRRAERDRIVKAHCAAIIASIPSKEPAE